MKQIFDGHEIDVPEHLMPAEMVKGKHTPTPWSVYEDVSKIAAPTECFTETSGIRNYKTASLTDQRGEFRNPSDAEFIVTACNAHDDLVRALKLMLDCFHYDPFEQNRSLVIEQAEDALEKAGAL